jgi:hypothetical protein
VLKKLADGIPPDQILDIAGDDLLRRGTRRETYAKWTKEFLNP